MLDFLLVLGQIPGTNFQITFYEYSLAILSMAAVVFRRQLWKLVLANKKQLTAYLRQKYWQHKQLKLPLQVG